MGGSSDDGLSEVVVGYDGSCIVGGTSSSGISGNKTEASFGGNDYWIVKLEPECLTDKIVYADADADGYGDPSDSTTNPTCELLSGYVLNNTDCNDADASINPDAIEILGDGIDNNCNGDIDEDLNNALSFDGVNDYVNIPHTPLLSPSQVTLECWVKPASINESRGLITKEPTGISSQVGYGFRQRFDNVFWFALGKEGVGEKAISSTQIVAGTWFHLAGTFDGITLKLYVNGILEGITTSPLVINSTTELKIGILNSLTEAFKGNIDEVRIWNVVRTQSEIQADMISSSCGDQNGFIAYYTFNQGIAGGINAGISTLNDITSNNNNGTLVNLALSGATSNWVDGVPGLSDSLTFYKDADNDSYGNPQLSITAIPCPLPLGYVLDNTDCNDANASMHPGAEEVFNCLDDNCNGITDEGKWIQKANFAGTARYNASGFTIGDKAYIGTGKTAANDYLKDFWEYDPVTNVWTQKANFGGSKRFKATGFAIGTKGYIGTGFDINGSLVKDFWEYDIATNAWTKKANFGGTGRQNAAGFSIGSKGYVGTGGDFLVQHNDFWEYDPATNNWTQKANVGDTLREAAVGFSIGEKGYIGTGSNSNGYKNDFWEYNPTTDTWTKKSDFAGGARSSASGFSNNNKGYLGTGLDGSSLHKDYWEYDPLTDTWNQIADFGGTARANATGFSVSGNGYVAIGGDTSGNGYNDLWQYDPPAFASLTVYADADNDGFGDAGDSLFVTVCPVPNGYVTDSTDCDDANAAINPAAIEICDGIDNNCDGAIDPLYTFYADSDGDGYGNNNTSVTDCAPPSGYVTNNTDCDDTNANVYPGAPEILFNGIDDDCDGYVDEFGTGITSIVNEEAVFSLFPNPTNGEFVIYLQLNNDLNAEAKIEVINLLGQVIYNKSSVLVKGKLQEIIKMADAANGMYLARVIVNEQVYSSQIVYEK